jgi:hypothetical protein
MTNKETINYLFDTLRSGSEQEQAKMREFIRRHENLHLLYSADFVRAAVANADLFPSAQLTFEEFEAQLDADAECPCCGHSLHS